ncbi:hypothetical protein HOC32_03050 [Candidatus Woesearchaeota archaeon]|nr:hypothetical protein [Candidatus Woesearchaeota archaeon]
MGDEMDLWYSPDTDYRSALLVEAGFIKNKKKDDYKLNKKTGTYEPVDPKCKINKSDAEEESIEILSGQYGKTGFPKAIKNYKLVWEVYDLSLEEVYFWIIDMLKDGFPVVEKLEDSFAAAENSAFFGASQQRLGAQQDRATNYLAQSGKMIKELFQMVRELRILDERLGYYNGAIKQLEKPINQRGKSDEITLKGIFIDLVQGGAKNAASIFGMAQQLEFITLPDLFFDAPPFATTEELENYIKGMASNFNDAVLRVLQRHLHQFKEWKKHTHNEHTNRKKFMLQYLYQHFEIVKMYLNWVKPYLRHVSKLTLKERNMTSADIVSAFEGSMLDIEVLFRNPTSVGKTAVSSCILATFQYRTRPELKVVQDGYQRGPVHIGQVEVSFRAYTWTNEEVAGYKKLKEKETLQLFGKVSSAVEEAMNSLGSELDEYLEEAKGTKKDSETDEEKVDQRTFMEKFLGDFYRAPQKRKKPKHKDRKEEKERDEKIAKLKKGLANNAKFHAWLTFNTFKKAHGMITW